MKPLLPGPCAHWAKFLDAHPADLAPADSAALDAHIATCPACAAARADNQDLDARIRGLPDPAPLPGFPSRLLALWEEEDRRKRVPYHVISSRLAGKNMHTQHDALDTDVSTRSPISPVRLTHRRRLVSGISAIAAVLVIALIVIALFASRAGSPAAIGHSGNQKPSPTPGTQGWISVPALSNSHIQPVLAPSDPRVVYEEQPQSVGIRRSDDDGAHWHSLSLPVPAPEVQSFQFMVNPAKAQNVFLVVNLASSSASCSSGQASTGQINGYSGGDGCQVQYASTDGGAHWGLMRWSAPVSGFDGTTVTVGSVVAQGGRLYSLVYDAQQRQRLIVSTDGGATWQPADASLLAQQQGLCNFAAAALGSTLFAFVQPGACEEPVGYLANNASPAETQSGLAVWRSDDAGAHWTQAGTFPYQSPDTQAFMAVGSNTSQPLLVGAAGMGDSYTRVFSSDGGATWQTLPDQGLPNDFTNGFLARTALSDGSLLSAQSTQEGNAWYAWRPGDQAWHQITPVFTGGASDPIVVSSPHGQDTLWLVTEDTGVFTVAHCQAQAQGTPPQSTSTPGATAGPGGQQGTSPIISVTTATGYTKAYEPINPTDTFKQGQDVDVIWQVRGAKAGDKILIKWYLNGVEFYTLGAVRAEIFTDAGDFNGAFTESYPSAASGKAELYWNGQLAWTVQFTITN